MFYLSYISLVKAGKVVLKLGLAKTPDIYTTMSSSATHENDIITIVQYNLIPLHAPWVLKFTGSFSVVIA